MMRLLAGLALLAFSACAAGAEPVSLGMRDTVPSKILGGERHISVYLPPSYEHAPATRYPVLYLVDGDYHYAYVAALLEQMAGVGEQIPEAILVAVGENGKKDFRREVSPDFGKGGDAAKLRAFLRNELIPAIDKRYRTTEYKALLGQSLAGLFAVDTLLEAPESFNAYVAVSPALWWDDKGPLRKAESVLKAKPGLKSRLFLSLGNERGMGVMEFVGLLENAAPRTLQWKFTRFEAENHGAIMLPALQWALKQEFSGYEMTSERFRSFAGAEQLLAHYRELKDKLGFEFVLSNTLFLNALSAYEAEGKSAEIASLAAGIARDFPYSLPVLQLARAELAMEAGQWPQALGHCQAAEAARPLDASWCEARAALGQGKKAEGRKQLRKALLLAKDKPLRQWRLNQLAADLREAEG